MIQRPQPSSSAIRWSVSSGIGRRRPTSRCARHDRGRRRRVPICGTIRIVPSSMSRRSVSTSGPRSSSFGARSQQRHVDLGLGHEPVAHLRDDPEVALHEHLVRRRAQAALVAVPGPVALASRPCPCASGAVGEDDLHPALRLLVDAVGHVAHAVVERVADDAAPAEVGDRDAAACGRRPGSPRRGRTSARPAPRPRSRAPR